MTYREYIEAKRRKWAGKTVRYYGAEYKVLDVDYNGFLLINKADQFKADTAVEETDVEEV